MKCSSISTQMVLKEFITTVGAVFGHQTNVAKQVKWTFAKIDINGLLQLNLNKYTPIYIIIRINIIA